MEQVEITERELADGGVELTLSAGDGYLLDNGKRELKVHVWRATPPRIGQRVIVCDGILIEVKSVTVDDAGKVFVVDDVGRKYPWQ